MSENAPSTPPAEEVSAESAVSSVDESQRIEDPQKAQAMAEAGHLDRRNAAFARELSTWGVGAKDDPSGKSEGPYGGIAKELDKDADIKEEEAGRLYDQSINATDGVGGTAVGAATQVSVAETPNDTRWDEDKARTVGSAAKEEDTNYRLQYEPVDRKAFDNWRLNRDRERERRLIESNEEVVAEKVGKSSEVYKRDYKEYQKLKNEIAELQDGDKEVPDNVRERFEVVRGRITRQAEYLREFEGRMVRAGESMRDEAIEQVIKPFEELYDLNPELFAKMPVPEFIEANRELREIEQDLVRLGKGQKRLIESAEIIKTKIDNRESIEWPVDAHGIYESIPVELRDVIYGADEILTPEYVYNGLVHGVERGRFENNLLAVLDEYEAVSKGDNFDKSPRQIMEAYQKLTSDYIDQARSLFADAEKRKKEFMAKYGKNSEVDQQVEGTS